MTVVDYQEQLKIRDEKITQLEGIIATLEADLKWEKAKHAALERRVFGSSSERLTKEDLQNLLPGLKEQPGDVYRSPQATLTTIPRTRQKLDRAGEVRANISAHIERVNIEVIPIEVQSNPESYQKIGEEVTQRLDFVPGKVICKQYIQSKFKTLREVNKIVQQPAPPTVNEKCLAEPGLVARVILQKHDLHLPYYRQSKHFWEKYGVDLHRNLLMEWGQQGSGVFVPIYDAMVRHIQAASYIQVDETPVRFLDPEIKGKTGKGQLWEYGIPRGEMIFEWKTNRSREGPEAFLINYKGHVQTDAYSVYESLEKSRPDLIFVGCMAHVRRRFFDAHKNDREAVWFLEMIGKLYLLERELREQMASDEERARARVKVALPILKQLKTELDKALPLIIPQSHFGKAVSYAHNNWDKLQVYVNQGHREIDNNICENSIRPTAVGKRNWLFMGSPTAGDTGAIIYSLIGSCRRLGINPHQYLTELLCKLPSMMIRSVEELEPFTPSGWLRARN